MHDDDSDLFRQEMADVEPIKNLNQVNLKSAPQATPGQAYRRRVAESSSLDENFLSTDFLDPVDPLDVLSFKRDGIQNGVFRRLKQGGYSIDASLDLHRLSVEQARTEVYKFIKECLQYDVRTALISHGKGLRSKTRPALLKSYLAKWLPMFPQVMAFHSARNFQGGVGAVYVLLRKSRNQKEKNRRRFESSK